MKGPWKLDLLEVVNVRLLEAWIYIDALRYGPQTDNAIVRKLCHSTTEIGNRAAKDCTDVLDEEVRGGTFYWFSKDFGGK